MARSKPAAKASTTATSSAAANSPTKAKQKKSKTLTCPPSWRIINCLKTAALKKTITGEEEEEEIVDNAKQLASPTKDHSSNKEEEEEAEISPTDNNNKDYHPSKKIAPKKQPLQVANHPHLQEVTRSPLFCQPKLANLQRLSFLTFVSCKC